MDATNGREQAGADRGAASPDVGLSRNQAPDVGAGKRLPLPPWLDETAGDFGAPQTVTDALVVRLGFQGTARLIADRPDFRAALIAEARRQSAQLRARLLYEEWHL